MTPAREREVQEMREIMRELMQDKYHGFAVAVDTANEELAKERCVRIYCDDESGRVWAEACDCILDLKNYGGYIRSLDDYRGRAGERTDADDIMRCIMYGMDRQFDALVAQGIKVLHSEQFDGCEWRVAHDNGYFLERVKDGIHQILIRTARDECFKYLHILRRLLKAPTAA